MMRRAVAASLVGVNGCGRIQDAPDAIAGRRRQVRSLERVTPTLHPASTSSLLEDKLTTSKHAPGGSADRGAPGCQGSRRVFWCRRW